MNIYVKKVDRTFAVDFDSLPDHVQEYIIDYGMKQRLADSIADSKVYDTETARVERIEAVIEAWYAGEVSTRTESSPMTKECKTIVIALLGTIGVNKKDAEALVKHEWQAGVTHYMVAKGADETAADFNEKFASNVAKIETKAEQAIAARAVTLD